MALIFLCTSVAVLSTVLQTLAHSPLTPGQNESLDTALEISEPAKSWAIYSELHEGGEAQYYSFSINKGERILISLFKTAAPEDREFLPSFALLGPNVTSQGTPPAYVEIPTGYGTIVINGSQSSEATYEPFSPSTFYQLAEKDLNASGSGTHYVAVYEPSEGGHYGLAVGYVEEFTISEWVLIPLNLINIHQWERQSLIMILAPLVVTLIVGSALIVWRTRSKGLSISLIGWLAVLAALFFLGTGFMTFYQMILGLSKTSLSTEAGITLVFALLPIILGTITLRIALGKKEATIRKRIYLAVIGIVSLFLWAGLYVGPALAIISSLLPMWPRQKKP